MVASLTRWFRSLCFAGAFLCLLGLSGCGQGAPADADWYRFQGYNVTECGPAVGAAAASFVGRDRSVAEARATNDRTFWRLIDIYEYLLSQGVAATWSKTAGLDRSVLAGDRVGIFYTGNHFYMFYEGKVFDPLHGVYVDDDPVVVGYWFITVRR